MYIYTRGTILLIREIFIHVYVTEIELILMTKHKFEYIVES